MCSGSSVLRATGSLGLWVFKSLGNWVSEPVTNQGVYVPGPLMYLGLWVFGHVVYGFLGRRIFASLGLWAFACFGFSWSLDVLISFCFCFFIEHKLPLSFPFMHLLITLQCNATIKELQSKANR